MRRSARRLITSVVLTISWAVIGGTSGSAQITNSAGVTSAADSSAAIALPKDIVTRLAYLTDAYVDTPGGMGIITTGMAEAAIASEHVRLAGQDSTDLANMVENMAHVLHAIDPNEVGSGLGLGYGVKRAAEEMIIHAEVMTALEGMPPNVLAHIEYVANAAFGALATADEAIALAHSIQTATAPEEALPRIEDLAVLIRAMAYGSDSDGDGRIGYSAEEFGLAQAEYHLTLLKRVQGLGR